MMRVPYPKLIGANFGGRTICPISMSVDLTLTPLSSASMVLPIGEEVPTRSYVEIFTSIGSAGIFRARSPEIVYGEGTSTTELEHAITEIGDWLIRGKIEGNYTIRAAMRAVFDAYHGTMWQLGSVSALSNSSDDKIDISYDHENCLTAMLDILENQENVVMRFNFSTTPWTVYFEDIGSVEGTVYGTLSSNVQSASVTYDDTDLCTYAYYQYGGSNWATFTAAQQYRDLYGRIEKNVDTDGDETQDVAKQKARKFIKRNHEPRVHIEISAFDLHAITGKNADAIALGKRYCLFIPEHNVNITRFITGLSWEDALNLPTEVTVILGDDDPELWGYLQQYKRK